jgi:5'-nucleotidase
MAINFDKILKNMKNIIYVDMDNVLVDFKSGIARLDDKTLAEYAGRLDEVPGIFGKMDPMPDAIASIEKLSGAFDLYILTTAPWLNPSAWIDKLQWVQKHFGKEKSGLFYKRLIITHHKNLNKGDFLIDDRPNNGAESFDGEWIHFGSSKFPDWDTVIKYLIEEKAD